MDDEELIDWFCAMENFFECEGIEEKEKVKIAKSRLKGHTFLWWDCIQADRWKNGKPKITSWYTMVEKMKAKFLPKHYRVQLYKKMRDFKHKELDVQKVHRGIPQA